MPAELKAHEVQLLSGMLTGGLFREDEAERAVVQKVLAAASTEEPVRLFGQTPPRDAPRRLTRKERDHLDVLQQRLDFLRALADGSDPETFGMYGGEANALAWVITLIGGEDVSDVEVRFNRVEHRVRVLEARLGRIEREWASEDEEEAETA